MKLAIARARGERVIVGTRGVSGTTTTDETTRSRASTHYYKEPTDAETPRRRTP